MKSKVSSFIFISLVALLILIINIVNKKVSHKISENHNSLYWKEIHGKVNKIMQNRGTVMLQLSNNSKKWIYFGDSRNYELDPIYIHRFINKGDSIFKAKKSDTLKIYREDKEYFFVLDKSINQ